MKKSLSELFYGLGAISFAGTLFVIFLMIVVSNSKENDAILSERFATCVRFGFSFLLFSGVSFLGSIATRMLKD